MQVNVQAWGSGFDELADQVHELINEMEGSNFFRSHAPDTWRPRLNLYETESRYVLCVELAGMRREEIELRMHERALYVRGLRKKPVIPEEAADVGVHLMEIDSGRFQRKIPLPSDVDAASIRATYNQGYLWVILPRTETPGTSDL